MNILVKYDDEYGGKNTNPLLLPSKEDKPCVPYIDPYLEAKYVRIKNLGHRGSVLHDSTNYPLVQASKAKTRATSSGANSLTKRTPNRSKTLT